jgi:hypothetical protein
MQPGRVDLGHGPAGDLGLNGNDNPVGYGNIGPELVAGNERAAPHKQIVVCHNVF